MINPKRNNGYFLFLIFFEKYIRKEITWYFRRKLWHHRDSSIGCYEWLIKNWGVFNNNPPTKNSNSSNNLVWSITYMWWKVGSYASQIHHSFVMNQTARNHRSKDHVDEHDNKWKVFRGKLLWGWKCSIHFNILDFLCAYW